MRKLTPKAMAAILAAVVLTTTSSFTTAQDKSQLPKIFTNQPAGEIRTVRPVQKRVEGLRDMILLNDPNFIKAVTRIELGRFWIGLNCAEVSPALRSQLKLDKDVGLLVVNAFEGSPSQAAGLKEHDIIIKADGKEISAVGQLIEAVQKAGESEIKLEIVREGQPKTITVKSAERPKNQQVDSIYLPQTGGEHRLLFRTPDGTITLIEPGVVVAPKHGFVPARTINGNLPAGVSITVTRKAGSEVSIHVEQNEKKWDITPKQIDELPKELQPHVRAMLGPNPAQRYTPPFSKWLIDKMGNPQLPQQHQVNELPKFTRPENHDTTTKLNSGKKVKPVDPDIENLRRVMTEELRQLRRAIEELQKSNKEK
jgi:membrane-associated protease RseP (regulator of RpoE activity)